MWYVDFELPFISVLIGNSNNFFPYLANFNEILFA